MNTGTTKVSSSVAVTQPIPGVPDLWTSITTKFVSSSSDPFAIDVCVDNEAGQLFALFTLDRDLLCRAMSARLNERVSAGLVHMWPTERDGEQFLWLVFPKSFEEIDEYAISLADLKAFIDKSSRIVELGIQAIDLDAEWQETRQQYLAGLVEHAFEDEDGEK